MFCENKLEALKEVKMKKLFLLVVILYVQACSDDDRNGSISQAQCDSAGGKMVNGQCQKEVPANQMKSICDSQGMKYVEEYNGCVKR